MSTFRPYIITTDSTVDLPESYVNERNLPIIQLSYTIDGETHSDNDPAMTRKEFYDKMRAGKTSVTTQVNPAQAEEFFLKQLDLGYDILHIAFSSGLSGTYNSAKIAAEKLSDEYPEAKIIVIDSLCASLGEGLLVHYALNKQDAGASIDEVAQWLEDNKLNLCHMFTVDDLMHLHRGGRVSKATAILGSLLSVKPVLHVDDEGHLIPLSKVRGRKQSLAALVDYMKKKTDGFDNSTIFISHGDCLEDAKIVGDLVTKEFGITDIVYNHVGAVIGSHSGPGTVALFFLGNKR